jgi:hypothetical protein
VADQSRRLKELKNELNMIKQGYPQINQSSIIDTSSCGDLSTTVYDPATTAKKGTMSKLAKSTTT